MACDLVQPGSFFSLKLASLAEPGNGKYDWLDDLQKSARCCGLRELADFLQTRGRPVRFLGAVMSLSSYLRETFVHHPHFLDPLRLVGLVPRLESLLAAITATDRLPEITENLLMQRLRRLKREAHALIALGDLGGVFTCEESTMWLTRLAEKTLEAALCFLLRELDRTGKIILKNHEKPQRDCGLIVLGMGKLGACELNYSSDIDLVVFIDETALKLCQPSACVSIFSRLTRRLVRIMHERTPDGYVFRMDLRLRPDPGATPLAMPVSNALRYYEARGQNWERAAMIKARPVAGDIDAAERFLLELSPFIWRKYLDFAAIADIHAIKRQIHAHKGHDTIAVRGHNIKLGRGGIREIEFFVQTQQLISGGRFAQLRGRRTLDMLATLCELGWITAEVRDALSGKYTFLRNVEHRIQMLADEQSHTLPRDEEAFLRVARLMGYRQGDHFSRDVLETLTTVEKHYAALFENERELGTEEGNLVFTGDDDDPETLSTLSGLGFSRPGDMCRIIRNWHFGRYRATRSAEARERLTELTPALLKAFGATQRADAVLVRFDAFLQGLPAGIQLFSLLQSNPSLLRLLVLIMSVAPRLADIITRRPHVFDGMLDPALFSMVPTRAYLEQRLSFFLRQVDVYEEILDHLRVFAAEQRFLIGVRLLTGAIDGEQAGRAFTDLADLMIAVCLDTVEEAFSWRHGRIRNGRIGILGMGKLGSREMTASSDIDLILLYDDDGKTKISDGEKPLPVPQYYTRLTQRLVSALSAPTDEGVLYKVDLRLRPSGNMGPVAVSFAAFGRYQRQEAWVWEHMALTRARTVAGEADFLHQLQNEVAQIIALPRDRSGTAAAVCNMRGLIGRSKPVKNIWDLKIMPGGIVDLEFIAQYAVLTAQAGFVAGRTTGDILRHLPEKAVLTDDAADLHLAYRLYTDLNQILRLCLDETFNPRNLPPGLSDLLQRIAGQPDMAHLEDLVARTAARVRRIFIGSIGIPHEQPASMKI